MAITFDEAMDAVKSMGIPEAGLAPFTTAWNTAFDLIVENNKRIAQVNAARAQDPSNVEYLDSLWKANEKTDPALTEKAEQFYAIAEEYEKLLKELREGAKKHIPVALSEEETKATRQLVNAGTDTIKTAVASARAMSSMIDGILAAQGKAIEGGIMSLMPEPDSLKSLRGRKAATGERGGYATRIGEFILNGRKVHRDGKVNFRYGADSVSTLMGAAEFPQNKVTGEEIEQEYFKSLPNSPAFRSLSSTEIPESHTFKFTKEVVTGENTTETRTVEITVKRKATAEAKPEAPKVETNAPAETANTKVETQPAKKADPVKQTAPAQKK